MKAEEKYRNATLATLTQEEIKRAQENFAFVTQRFPQEHARASEIIEEKGLSEHREVLEWYARYRTPIPEQTLRWINAYRDSTYAGSFGKGTQREAPAGRTPADRMYRKEIRPEGQE